MTNLEISEHAIKSGATQKVDELELLLDQLGSLKGKTILEIGSYSGGTLEAWKEAEAGKIIAVDVNHLSRKEGVTYVTGNSNGVEVLEAVKRILGTKKVDVLFIDGDHSFNHVQDDFTIFKSLVKRNGVIILHDIVKSEYHDKHKCEVDKLWSELIKDENLETKEIITDPKDAVHGWGGFGIITV